MTATATRRALTAATTATIAVPTLPPPSQQQRQHPPLRVIVTREGGFNKMRISGRMADVCAALNRLTLH